MEPVLSSKASPSAAVKTAAVKTGAAQIGPKAAAASAFGPLLIENRFRIVGPGMNGLHEGGIGGELAGLACFDVRDNRSSSSALVALRADPETPLRAQLPEFIQLEHEGLIAPLAHGGAGEDYWVVCAAPAGPSFASLSTPWSGNSLLVHVLRPAALALDQLQLSGLTHRSIRPDNLFPAADRRSTVLGPAWTGPPAARQPCVFEPVSSAVCGAEARGQGTIADDVYALGVLLLALWTGEVPLAGRTPREIVQLKIEQGSHAALTAPYRLPRTFEELLRGMLADDAVCRPGPSALINVDVAHIRRGAPRIAARASRPMVLGARVAWNRRGLAFDAAAEPALALAAFRDGSIELWLRRNTDDAVLAAKLEEHRHSDQLASRGGSPGAGASSATGDDLALMRLIALLDPLAPLFCQGVWLWPDGLGSILAAALVSDGRNIGKAAQPGAPKFDAQTLLEALVLRGLNLEWQAMRPQQQWCQVPSVPQSLLLQRAGDEARSVLLRAAYWLNPLLPCSLPYPGIDRAAGLAPLLLALEKAATSGGLVPRAGRQAPSARLLDQSMHGFIAARLEFISPSKEASVPPEPDERFRDLSILARSQSIAASGPLPGLASVLLQAVEPVLRDWPGLARREERSQRLRARATQGDLRGMLALLDDPTRRKQDEAARKQASAVLAEMRARLAARAISLPARLDASRAVARDTAAAAGLCCIAATLLYELLR